MSRHGDIMPVTIEVVMFNEHTREVVTMSIIAQDAIEAYDFRDHVFPTMWGWRQARISLDMLKP